MNWKKYALLILGLLLGLFLVSCGGSGSQSAGSPCPTAAPCPDCPPAPSCPPAAEAAKAPYQDQWAGSAHADVAAEAFNHWNEEDPKEVPASCAKCHSTPGYQDFLGADGSAAGTVDKGAAIGTVITCDACHNDAAAAHTSVVFPSGVEVTGLGPEARCMECHQGRSSGPGVDAAIQKAGVTDEDTPSDKLSFVNLHYSAAAATQYGAVTNGGYQYAGQMYDVKFTHVEGMDTCIDCHDQHTLELKIEKCGECHGVKTVEELRTIREPSSSQDYDGDGDTTEGIAAEIEGLQGLLLQAIQAYGKEVSKVQIGYNPAAHPYFFADPNGDGQITEDEAISDNTYKAWTARLLKAAYNYQMSIKDPGAYAHNGKYVIELLHDSIADLNTKLSTPIDLSKTQRIDAGHFAGSEMAFRDWDSEGEVPGTCAKCHSAAGLPMYLKNGATIGVEVSNGFMCSTCHDEANWPNRYEAAANPVKFPSGATIDSGSPDMNLCITCHQGRESTTSINAAIKGLEDDAVSDKLRFKNVHYFAAGATLFGTEAKGAYEYADQTYLGRNAHVQPFSECTQCHDTHALKVNVEACAGCHATVKSEEDLSTIRMSTTDFDGDGDTTEGIAGEIGTMYDALYAAMQSYAKDVAGSALVYSASSYPYFFTDTNGNGVLDPDEAKSDNSYKTWTPRLLRAAYNYQYVTKDPGAFAHNGKYIIQVLFDTLNDLGAKVTVDTSKMTRP